MQSGYGFQYPAWRELPPGIDREALANNLADSGVRSAEPEPEVQRLQELLEETSIRELEEPEVPEEKPPPKEPEQEMATIQCPGCSAKMTVPKLAKLQTVTCENCGLSGELKI